MKLCDTLFYLLIPSLILLHLIVAPYTKVEESFNIQATHDILAYGVPLTNAESKLQAHYDHFTFPSPVPRTFVGALLLAGLAHPLTAFEWVDRQMLVRGILGLLNSAALAVFARAVSKSFGKTAGRWYLLFQASQFHIIYYASRTLPNMFAFGLTTLALAALLPSNQATSGGGLNPPQRSRLALYLLTISGVIFRSEIALLLGTHTIYLYLIRHRLSLRHEIIPAGLSGLVIGLAVAVPIDSFFSQYFPTWAELAGFYFNAVQGKSSDWGTSPWWFYLFNALPRLLLNPLTFLLCIPLALANISTRSASMDILIPNLAFVGIYSIQPHKEWRFIVYVVPALTAAASLGAAWIWNRRAKSMLYVFLALALVGSVLASFAASTAMLTISSLNYPGAVALQRLHHIVASSPSSSSSSSSLFSSSASPSALPDGAHTDIGGGIPTTDVVKVHLDDLSCKTGITRFLQLDDPEMQPGASRPIELVLPTFTTSDDSRQTSKSRLLSEGGISHSWIYDKSNDEANLLDPLFWLEFDYVLAEHPERVIGMWEEVDQIHGFAGIGLTRDCHAIRDDTIGSCEGDETGPLGEEDVEKQNDVQASRAKPLEHMLYKAWRKAEKFLRTKVTRGYWVEVKMRPMIYILKRQTRVPAEVQV
ncbi:glycosyltransferase family 22 protein [Xylona heveae TC161]|uniref:Mannosyltransferase n=1 Tax=Xylona heveae (strain CBS 132557 / TC161) TaxID=1328760 RepID=A0A165J9Z6_XYLHT|nr:glycosyltransferase family 22 protein [Xylona heveae TC161]KZF25953.1 glycosyltransferase family 22 protein [Xylona heveae TC161]